LDVEKRVQIKLKGQRRRIVNEENQEENILLSKTMVYHLTIHEERLKKHTYVL